MMRFRSGYAVVALCLLVALGVFTLTSSSAKPDDAAAAAARWEHLALKHDGAEVGKDREVSKQINRLGDEGWQLVSVSTVVKDGTTTKTVFYFKRPK